MCADERVRRKRAAIVLTERILWFIFSSTRWDLYQWKGFDFEKIMQRKQ